MLIFPAQTFIFEPIPLAPGAIRAGPDDRAHLLRAKWRPRSRRHVAGDEIGGAKRARPGSNQPARFAMENGGPRHAAADRGADLGARCIGCIAVSAGRRHRAVLGEALATTMFVQNEVSRRTDPALAHEGRRVAVAVKQFRVLVHLRAAKAAGGKITAHLSRPAPAAAVDCWQSSTGAAYL